MSQETQEAGRDRHRGPETLHDLIMVNRRYAYGKDKEVVYMENTAISIYILDSMKTCLESFPKPYGSFW